MKLKSKLFTRHPKAVLIYNEEEGIKASSLIIAETVDEYRAIHFQDNCIAAVKEYKPQLLILGMEDVLDNMQFYYQILNEESLKDYIHKSILLCGKTDGHAAFHLCMEGLFDDYVVIKPLYEQFRLKFTITKHFEYSTLQNDLIDEHRTFIKKLDEESRDIMCHCKDVKEQLRQNTCKLESTLDTVTQNDSNGSSTTTGNALALQECLDVEKRLQNSLQVVIESISAQKQLVEKNILRQHHTASKVDALKEISENKPGVNANEADGPKDINRCKSSIPDKKILIVDDDYVFAEMLTMILAQDGFVVHMADCGKQAVRMAKKDKFDVILMDLFMPDQDGIRTTRELREIKHMRKVPIIGLSGNKKKSFVLEWIKFGLRGYIMKPSNREEILSKVNSVLKRNKNSSPGHQTL